VTGRSAGPTGPFSIHVAFQLLHIALWMITLVIGCCSMALRQVRRHCRLTRYEADGGPPGPATPRALLGLIEHACFQVPGAAQPALGQGVLTRHQKAALEAQQQQRLAKVSGWLLTRSADRKRPGAIACMRSDRAGGVGEPCCAGCRCRKPLLVHSQGCSPWALQACTFASSSRHTHPAKACRLLAAHAPWDKGPAMLKRHFERWAKLNTRMSCASFLVFGTALLQLLRQLHQVHISSEGSDLGCVESARRAAAQSMPNVICGTSCRV
jgi:hypothetical protein